jgi:hypothetical protein
VTRAIGDHETFFPGVIRNTVVLNYSVSHSYILSVVAYDCGMRRSEPLLVTVEVRQACNTGWTGKLGRLMPKQIGEKIAFF